MSAIDGEPACAGGTGAEEPKGEQVMKVRKLAKGTVIDHLTKGTAFNAFRVLGLSRDTGVVLIGINLRSDKAGCKDLIKIEKRELNRDELNRVALMSPQAIISIIDGYHVIKKFPVEIPERIEGIIRCRNPRCITTAENVRSIFLLCRRDPLTLRCWYCERRVLQGEFEFIV